MAETLTLHAPSANGARMGRPALGVISTTVRLPKQVLDRIDTLMGANQRAKFIREAVERELDRRERQS